MSSRLCFAVVGKLPVMASALLLAPMAASAQAPTAPNSLPALARYVPADAGLFVEVDSLLQIGAKLKQQDLWEVVQPLIGDEQSGWTKALADSLGVESTLSMARMFREQVAIAAPDWRRLGDGIVVFTQSNPRVLQSIVNNRRARRVRTSGSVRLYRTRTGLWIAIHNQTVILAQTRGEGTFFDRSLPLLTGDKRDGLMSTEPFRQLFAELPSPQLASAFWKQSEPAEDREPLLGDWWPQLREGALALLTDEQQFEIVLRGVVGERESKYRPRVHLDRLSALPQATLAAWATSIDARALFSAARESDLPRLRELAGMLGQHANADQFESDIVGRVGPRCVVCLGSDLSAELLDPQVALLFESVDADRVIDELRTLVESFVSNAAVSDRAPVIELENSEHLGVRIHELRWRRQRASEGTTLSALLTESMSPCFAAVDGWVVISSSPNQMRELIEARAGVTNRLEPTIQLVPQRNKLRKAVTVAVLQPTLMQSMFRYWDSILDERHRMQHAVLRLGAELDPEQLAGQVRILSVDSNGPANGLLEPGDALFACDGALLSMDDPAFDIRRLIAGARDGAPITLRVMREGTVEEVQLPPLAIDPPPGPTGLAVLATKLAPLERLAAQTRSVTFSVDRTADRSYQARVLLQLSAPRRVRPAPVDKPEAPPE